MIGGMFLFVLAIVAALVSIALGVNLVTAFLAVAAIMVVAAVISVANDARRAPIYRLRD